MSTSLFSPAWSAHLLRTLATTLLILTLPGHEAWAAKPTPPPAPAPTPAPVLPGYFFSMDLDAHYQFVGTGALTEEDAAKANCYRFIYNQDGKLREIDYRRAGTLMPDPLFQAAQIGFEYQPGIERRWYRDAQGQAIRGGGVAGEELTLNPAGYATTITNLDASGGHTHDGSGVISYVRTLDNHNRVVSCRRIGLFGNAITDDSGFFETRTVYDAQGYPIERGNYDSSGNLLNNNDGVALIRTIRTIYPDSIQTVESYFDASGLPVEEKSSGVHTLQRTNDNRGLLVDESYFDTTGAPCLDLKGGIHERRYVYDDNGNQLSEAFFDTDGKPINRKGNDYARISYKYDDKNRVVEIAYFGDDGTPQVLLNSGYAILRLTYDDKGSVARQQFFDGQGHPSPHVKYGSPAICIKVDGDTTIITLRDADDHPMKNPVGGFYAFSYKTATDSPLSLTNRYFDRHGYLMSLLRVRIINPHLHALKTTPVMKNSAHYGAGAVGLGALLACFLALRKSSHTKRRKVYVPTAVERFLGWFSVFAILEGSLRFFMTVYWAWVDYQNGRLGYGVYILETIFIVFFLFRFFRLNYTMRVLNIGRDDIHRLVRDFFARAGLKPEWDETHRTYVTPLFRVRINYFQQKCHAYLAFWSMGAAGHSLARAINQYLRAHTREVKAPVRTLGLALYYPSVAFCYFLLSCTAFYTLWQMLKRY